MSNPKPGWTLAQAVALLEQGYRAEQVERLTGFAARHVTAAAASTRPPRPPGATPGPRS